MQTRIQAWVKDARMACQDIRPVQLHLIKTDAKPGTDRWWVTESAAGMETTVIGKYRTFQLALEQYLRTLAYIAE